MNQILLIPKINDNASYAYWDCDFAIWLFALAVA